MDSNFRVKIDVDISDLNNRLKAVEAQLQKFSQSAERAAGSTNKMNAEANRGRLVAFAFGQVVRDAGFFANSFSLGILAISNNIPILIDQLSLSVKALQPFAGALSLIGSLLTAGLTIWAYSSQAVKKNKESIDDYIKSLDDVREAQLKGAISADSEIRTLELLRRAAQNETFSKKERLKAVKELQERFPDYYASLSAETIMAGKDAKAHEQLANAIMAVAKAEAYKELIKENKKVQLADNQKLVDLQAEIIKQKAIIAKSKEEVGSLNAAKRRLAATNKIRETEEEIYRVAKERNKARSNNISLEKLLTGELEKQKNISIITGGFGEIEDIGKKTDAFQEYANAIKAINANQATTELEKLNAVFSAQKTLLDALSKETYQGVADDMKVVGDSMLETKNQILALESSAKSLNELNEKLITFKNIGEALDKRRLDIYSGIDTTKSQKIKQDIEATSDAIIAFQAEISKTQSGTIIEFLNKQIDVLKQKLSELGVQFKESLNIEIAAKNASEWAQYLAQTVGGDLVNAFNQMMTTGKFSFESIGRALLGMIKKLAAAAIAAGILSAILSSLTGGAAGTSFKDMFKAISGINLVSGINAAPIAQVTTGTSMNTSMVTSSAMSQSMPVLETRVSGNDLVILLDRASNNRNKYF